MVIYELGSVTKPERLANWCLSIAKQAEKNTASGKFEILENSAKVRVMGTGIFEHLSRALDNSLKMTQGFMIGCALEFSYYLFFYGSNIFQPSIELVNKRRKLHYRHDRNSIDKPSFLLI